MFVADAEISSVSDPWDIPVISQVAVVVVDNVPMFTVGVSTEK